MRFAANDRSWRADSKNLSVVISIFFVFVFFIFLSVSQVWSIGAQLGTPYEMSVKHQVRCPEVYLGHWVSFKKRKWVPGKKIWAFKLTFKPSKPLFIKLGTITETRTH